MAEFPALPIYTDAFIADTLHLTSAQTGAYFMLLMCAWRSKDCSIPDDDAKLAAFSRMDKRAWAANKETIMAFWTRNNVGGWVQKRLLDERKNAEDRRNQAIQAGKSSALKRKGRHSTPVATTVQPESNNTLTYPIPILKERETDAPATVPISDLTSLECHPLGGAYEDWRRRFTPDVNMDDTRRALVLHCKAKGERFQDYWSALQGWMGTRQQRHNEKHGKKPVSEAAMQAKAENEAIMARVGI